MRRFLKILAVLTLLGIALFFSYFNNTALVDSRTVSFYDRLKDTLSELGYSDRLLVISAKRLKWQNDFQVKTTGAASKSRHLVGQPWISSFLTLIMMASQILQM